MLTFIVAICAAQVTLEANKLQLAFRQATELLHLHRCRGQTAELVPVLLLLGELHQHADSPVAALPHVLSCLSLCDVFSMELYRGEQRVPAYSCVQQALSKL